MNDRIIVCDECGEICEPVICSGDAEFDYECPECGWWICEDELEEGE